MPFQFHQNACGLRAWHACGFQRQPFVCLNVSTPSQRNFPGLFATNPPVARGRKRMSPFMWRSLHKKSTNLLSSSHSAPAEVAGGRADGTPRSGEGLAAKRARPPQVTLLLKYSNYSLKRLQQQLRVSHSGRTNLSCGISLIMPIEMDMQMI